MTHVDDTSICITGNYSNDIIRDIITKIARWGAVRVRSPQHPCDKGSRSPGTFSLPSSRVAGGHLLCTRPWFPNIWSLKTYLNNAFSNLLVFRITRFLATRNLSRMFLSTPRWRMCDFRLDHQDWCTGVLHYFWTFFAPLA